MKFFRFAVICLLALGVSSVAVHAQTSSSSLVNGTVYDKSGAVVPGAIVTLKESGTNTVFTQTSNESGQFLFPAVLPGTYRVSVFKEGFREYVMPAMKVTVGKSVPLNVTVEVGQASSVMTVEAAAGAQMQQTDATVGASIEGQELKYLPTPNRSVSALMMLQPLVAPLGRGIGTDNGGQVAGARSDQSTMLIDGGDATSDTEASGGYNSGFAGEIRPMIPVPAESIEEFRVGTTNPNATFGRAQGGQVMMVTKHGTNAFHGSGYWYHQNDNLNANSWDLNTSGIQKKELKDNRFGFTAGGPIFKDKLFFFAHYEARFFPQSATFTRLLPTATLRQGIIRMRDSAGTITSYNLNTANGALSAACASPGVANACDPRALGASAVALAELNTLPAPPATGIAGIGDGLNTIGYRNTVSVPLTEKFSLVRLDYKFSEKWNFFASGRYQSFHQPGSQQIDIVGGAAGSGCTAPCSTRVNPLQPRYFVAGANGQFAPTLLSETRVSWFRHWWEWGTAIPKPQVAGTAAALSLAGEGTGAAGTTKIAEPYNIDTQNARSRIWNGKDSYVSENLTWLKGKHNFQFGGNYRFQNIFHQRTDKVTGGLATGPIFYLNAGSFFSVVNGTDTFRPPNCGGVVLTNCINSAADRTRWNNWYAMLMGIPDKTAQVLTRDGNLNPQPFGTTVQAQVHIQAIESYFQDIWRVSPTLTLTLGVTYQIQVPPTEGKGRQTVPVFASTGAAVNLNDFFHERELAAAQGNILNPDIAYTPIKSLKNQDYVENIDLNNVGPRLAFAWHPTAKLLGLGDNKGVIRGGWSTTYTRLNGVGLVMTPVLGVGLASIQSCNGPRTGGVCAGISNPTNAFRIGPDGNGSTILPSAQPIPVASIPFNVSAPFGETRSFSIDPGFSLGYSHSFDLTYQRELPWNLLLEAGYVGRLGRNLPQGADFNAVPFMFKDKASGQTIAQAFTAVETQIQTGAAVTAQPFFENQVFAAACFGGKIAASAACPAGTGPAGVTTATAYLSNQFANEIGSGTLSAIFLSSSGGIDVLRRACGLSATCVPGMQPFDNIQVQINNFTTHTGFSNYNAAFFALHKRMARGLTFDVNYTLSHSLDSYGLNQENVQFSFTSPFRPKFDYEPSIFDRRHTFNAHWYYELPFGKGKKWANSNAFVDKVFGGWHFAGIYTAASGQPICFFDENGTYDYGTPNPQQGCLNPGPGFKRQTATVNRAANGDLNLFANPGALTFDPTSATSAWRTPLMTTDGRFGFGALRDMGRWTMDWSFGKTTSVTERVKLTFSADFLNVFNHPLFDGTQYIGAQTVGNLGAIGAQSNLPRYIQLGFRIEF
ncbi:MAG: carboxypeptidase regulatory-like domain-containing protein [Acidobacteria bacterium]|nr:carboxypeptidase regulatory-like domain-containing protein [Acidobacteriota bacterium]